MIIECGYMTRCMGHPGKKVVMLPSESQLHSTTAIFPLSFVTLVLIIWLSSEKVCESLQKTGERLWKIVFMYKSQHALQNAVLLQWMLDRMGWGWMNIFGVIVMLRYTFEINKQMFELANTVRFTEYLSATFKSLPPNIYISTSVSKFDDA